jgi:hypothetical protein
MPSLSKYTRHSSLPGIISFLENQHVLILLKLKLNINDQVCNKLKTFNFPG